MIKCDFCGDYFEEDEVYSIVINYNYNQFTGLVEEVKLNFCSVGCRTDFILATIDDLKNIPDGIEITPNEHLDECLKDSKTHYQEKYFNLTNYGIKLSQSDVKRIIREFYNRFEYERY
jgi:hypothetical protein